MPVFPLTLTQFQLGMHINCFQACFRLAANRANVHTDRAPGAVLNSHLQGIVEPFPLRQSGLSRLERGRCKIQKRGIVDFAANHSVRAYEDAFAALDTKISIPNGNLLGKVTLFETRSAGRKSAVNRHSTDRDFVAATREDFSKNVPQKRGLFARRSLMNLGLR